ncbi:MAG TPA: acyltransferase domain-containing protein [Methylovirgula sp.]|jgi:acyl transferase domain-containing protein|nr:acyltransferase domain-containing protein [Methylovirgula sp.]
MLRLKTVFMFSGLGSHHFQMGQEFFEENVIFRAHMLRLDEIVRDLTKRAVLDVLYDPRKKKSDPLREMFISSVALFMVEYSLAQVLIEKDFFPDFLLSTSFGFFAAACIAKIWAPDAAIAAIHELTKIFSVTCSPGAMAAVLNGPHIYRDNRILRDTCEIAGNYFPQHFAIAMPNDEIARVTAVLNDTGTVFQNLPVEFAFHSRWIDRAKQPSLGYLDQIECKPAETPIICCSAGETLEHIEGENFWRTLRAPVAFEKAILRLEASDDYQYLDVSPASSLATFFKYARPASSNSKATPLMSVAAGETRNLQMLLEGRRPAA